MPSKTYLWIEDRKGKSSYVFWEAFMREICPEVVVESKMNNRDLVKAVKGLSNKEKRYIIAFDNSFDNVQIYGTKGRFLCPTGCLPKNCLWTVGQKNRPFVPAIREELYWDRETGGDKMTELKITSPAFEPGGWMPNRNAGFGEDFSPEIHIDGIDASAVSMVITLDDLDYPIMPAYNHWIAWNMQPTNGSAGASARRGSR